MAKQESRGAKINPIRQQALEFAKKADKSLGSNSEVVDKLGSGTPVDNHVLQKTYNQKDASYFEPYEEYIDRNTLHSGQYTTAQLDKMLEERKHEEKMFVTTVSIVSIIVILVLWRLISLIRKDSPISNQSTEDENITRIELNRDIEEEDSTSSDVNSLIEKIEKLQKLKESGAITDLEFEQMKKKAISNNK
jgi:hypothetical protein